MLAREGLLGKLTKISLPTLFISQVD